MAAKVKRRKAPATARERILASARQLFAQRGFEGTSTKDIAAHAGVPSGLVFYYFETKDALIDAVFEDNPASHIVTMMWDASRQNTSDPIESALRAAYETALEHRYQAYILMTGTASARPIAKRLRQMRKNALAAFADFFRAQSGGTKPALEPEILAQVVSSSILSAVLLDEPQDVEAYIKGLTSIVRAGLSPAVQIE